MATDMIDRHLLIQMVVAACLLLASKVEEVSLLLF